MNKPHIVIVGGGFGGVYTGRFLKSLLEDCRATITLISRDNYFLFTPLLHEVAGGGLSPRTVMQPIREIFKNSGVRYIEAEVSKIDSTKKTLLANAESISFDYLVVSVGSTTNFYGVPGAEEHALTLKTVHDALSIRKSIISSCEQASRVTDETERRKLLSCVIVGGGATGVELAGELAEFMQVSLQKYFAKTEIREGDMSVTLVSTSELLPQFPPQMGVIAKNALIKKGVTVLTMATVTKIDKSSVTLGDGTVIRSDCVVWVAGVKPSEVTINSSQIDKGGRIMTDEFLRLKNEECIFVLGDAACAIDEKTGKPYPMLAQVASQQARSVAINIRKTIEDKKLQSFAYHQKGLLISLGQWNAAGIIFGVTLSGPFMWWVWRTVYLFNFHSWKKRVKIAVEWSVGLFYSRDISVF